MRGFLDFMRRLVSVVGIALLLLVGVGVYVGKRFYESAEEPYRGYVASDVFVEIHRGMSSREIGRQLVSAGVIRDEWVFRIALWRSGLGEVLQAGEYRFFEAASAMSVVDTLAKGRVHLRAITFPEGLTVDEMAQLFQQSGFGSADSFLDASQRVELVASWDPEAPSLEGYLFPETYSLPRGATAEDLVAAMVAQFGRVFDDGLWQRSVERGLSVREVVTLASLVQKETGLDLERPLVSAVYLNRLGRGMLLQCDPTVIYGLRLAGLYDGNLTRANLRFDSPYNTYVYPGLPPGPIAAPGAADLTAVVEPADVSYLYFVSRNDGSHVFADTLREHNQNVRDYQVEYFRRRR